MIKAEFSASLLQSSVSHDTSEIIKKYVYLLLKKYFSLALFKTVVLLTIFVETVTHLFQDSFCKGKKHLF